jgi:outer membrane protein, adhesin transport system
MSNYRKPSRYLIPAIALIVLAGPVYAETLEDAIRAAITTHPSVEGAQAESGAAQAEKKSHTSGYFPTVRVNGSTGRIYGDNATSRGLNVTRGAGYSNMWNGSVSATEKIFTGFETTNRIKSAQSKKTSADMNVMDVRENLAYRAAQAYLDVMRAREGLALLKSHGAKTDDYLSRIDKMVEDGGSDNAELQQARDISVILSGLIDDYEGQVRAAESNYFDMTGHAPDELTKPVLDETMLPGSLEDALGAALKMHPSLQAAAYSAESAAYDMEAEKAPLYPSLEGELSYMKEEKRDLIGGEIEDGRAVVNLNWMFETGGGQIARIREKKYTHARALSAARETQKQVELGTRLAWSEYQTALEQVANQSQRQELNAKLFDTYKVQFEGAKISLLQLMQGDNQLFTTHLEKINGEYRLLAAKYALLGSMGRLQQAMDLTTLAEAESSGNESVPDIEPAAGETDESGAEAAAAIEPSAGQEACNQAECGLLTQP